MLPALRAPTILANLLTSTDLKAQDDDGKVRHVSKFIFFASPTE
jgi:hypothetical protein